MTSEAPRVRFQTLLERHRKIVFKVAAMYCAHARDRRDLAQEISAQLWRSFARYDERRPFAIWMYRVALNVAIPFAHRGRIRARPAAPSDEDEADPIDESSVASEDGDSLLALQGFVEKLDDPSRALLFLYLEDQSHREIAEVLGLSETSVALKIQRLKQRIQREVRCAEYR